MKVFFNNTKGTRKFQEGGAMPAEAPAAEQGGGADPLAQVAQIAMQALQNQDCNAAMQVCQVFVQMLQQSQGGGAPEAAPEATQPVYRKGGTLVRRIKK